LRPLALPSHVCHLQNSRGIGASAMLKTVEQVWRIFRILAGFTLLLAGLVMIVTPGPGWLTILLGLGLLAAEFVWARRLMDRIKREGGRIRETVLGKSDKSAAPDTPAPDTPAPEPNSQESRGAR